MPGVFEGGGFVAAAVAIRAGDIEIGEELHLDFFKAVAGAAVAAAGPGIEREKAGFEAGGGGGLRLAKKLADGFKGTQQDSRGGTRGAGHRGLIDEFDAAEVL